MKKIRALLRRQKDCREEREGCALASKETVDEFLASLDDSRKQIGEQRAEVNEQRARWDAMQDRLLALQAERYRLTPDK